MSLKFRLFSFLSQNKSKTKGNGSFFTWAPSCTQLVTVYFHRCMSPAPLTNTFEIKGKSSSDTERCTDTSAPRQLRHQDTSAPVPKCLGHFGTDNRGSQLVNGGNYVVDGEGSLKRRLCAAFSELWNLWVLKSAQWCDRAIDRNFCGECFV